MALSTGALLFSTALRHRPRYLPQLLHTWNTSIHLALSLDGNIASLPKVVDDFRPRVNLPICLFFLFPSHERRSLCEDLDETILKNFYSSLIFSGGK